MCAVRDEIDPIEDIVSLIDDAISPEAPALVREGKIIKEGYSEEVDRLRIDMEGGSGAMARIEASERERTGIKTLRVRYNRVFG